MAADGCISKTLGTDEGTLRLEDPEVLVNLVVADSEDGRILGMCLLYQVDTFLGVCQETCTINVEVIHCWGPNVSTVSLAILWLLMQIT